MLTEGRREFFLSNDLLDDYEPTPMPKFVEDVPPCRPECSHIKQISLSAEPVRGRDQVTDAFHHQSLVM